MRNVKTVMKCIHVCAAYVDSRKKHFEPPHGKTKKMTFVPSEDSDQPGHPPSLIRVFAMRSMDSLGPNFASGGQRWLWSDWSVRVAERLALPTSDHGVAGSNPAGGEILPEPKRRYIAQSLSCSPFRRLEMTEILLKGRKTLTHPSIWSDWADANADLSLRWAHRSFCCFYYAVAQFSYWNHFRNNWLWQCNEFAYE